MKPSARIPSIRGRAVGRVARAACRQPALFPVLRERFVQRRDHMRRRREAPLPGAPQVGMLIVQVERERGRAARAILQQRLPDDHETHARHAFQALAAGRDQRVDAVGGHLDGQRAERAHRVDDQRLAVPCADRGDPRERIEDAGAGLQVHQRDMRDARLAGEQGVDRLGAGGLVLGERQLDGLDPEPAEDLQDPRAVGAVVGHQHHPVARHQGAERRFHREGAAALQGHAGIARIAAGDPDQVLAERLRQTIEGRVPRAPVVQHRPARGRRRGQRAGRQKNRVVVGNHVASWLKRLARHGRRTGCFAS